MTSPTQSGPDTPPVPVGAGSIDDLTDTLRELRAWAGNPSYAVLAQRVATVRLVRGMPRSEAVVGKVTVYDCFREGRRRLDMGLVLDLVTALGVEPAGRVRWRQALRAVLTPGAGPVRSQVVAQPPVPHVVGRDAERAQVLGAVVAGPVVITGMAGSGKTSLAVRAAHELAEGQGAEVLVLDLQGSSADQRPVDVAAAAAALLQQMRPDEQTGDLAEVLAGLGKALRSGRYVVVLDDAASAEQVAALLPEPDGGTVLITSRLRLPDLPDGHEVLLGPLGLAESLELLAHHCGRQVPADAHATALVELTAGLPLTLSLLGRRLAAQPSWPLVDHLEAYRSRLARASLDEPVEAALQVTYDALPDTQRQALRRLSWHPTRSLGLSAVETLCQSRADELRPILAGLVDANLLTVLADERWEVHELVRAFAAARSLEHDPPSHRRDGTVRVIEAYLAWASRAVAILQPASALDWYWQTDVADEADVSDESTAPGAAAADAPDAAYVSGVSDSDPAWARTFLAEEAATVMAGAVWAAEHEMPELAVRLAVVLAPYLWQHGGVDATYQLQLTARISALRTGDEMAMALTERNLGQTLLRAGRFDQAGPYLDRALAHYGAVGHADGQISILNALGYLASSVGDDDRSISIFADLSGRLEQTEERWAIASSNLAVALARTEQTAKAVPILQDVARVAADQGWAVREQWALSNLSGLLCDQGQPAEGRRAAERALALAAEADDEVGRAYSLSNLAVAHQANGDPTWALTTAQQALADARALEAPDLEASVLNHLGDFALARGDHPEARDQYADALAVAEAIGEASEARRARDGLSQLEKVAG